MVTSLLDLLQAESRETDVLRRSKSIFDDVLVVSNRFGQLKVDECASEQIYGQFMVWAKCLAVMPEVPELRIHGNDFSEKESETEAAEVEAIIEEVANEVVETPHLQQEARMKAKIERIETEMLSGDKPWQLSGEVEAKSRPSDSVLEQYLEFDRQTKVSIPLTAEHTEKIEAIVRRRIKDKAFDDVERKLKPNTSTNTIQAKLDFEKSEKGLADIYAESYVEKIQGSTVEPGSAEREGVKEAMRTLFKKLNALSHSLFTPSPALPRLKLVSNLKSVEVEEIGQVAENTIGAEFNLLAPEEVAPRLKRVTDEPKRKRRTKRKVVERQDNSNKKNNEEKQILEKAKRLLKRTPNMKIAEKEMAKPRKKVKLLA